MVTCGQNGNVIVRDGAKSYDLSVSDEYSAFILLITSPDNSYQFDDTLFTVDANLADEARTRAQRYADFLSDYAKRRSAKLQQDQSLTAEERERAIRAFIERLQDQRDDFQ